MDRIYVLRTEDQRATFPRVLGRWPLPMKVVIGEWHPTRTNEQNKRMWAMLTDISRQVVWHGNKLRPEEWKDVFTAALKRQRSVPGLEGGFVVLGTSTSRMTIQEMTDLIELMFSFGAEHDVEWSEQ